MIGQRLLAPGRSLPVPRRHAGLTADRITQPLQIERERLRESLGASWLVQLTLAMSLVALAALIYLNQASRVDVLQFQIADLRQQQSQLNLQNANLYASASALRALPRVEAVASTQLHMTHPDLSTSIWVDPVIPVVAPPPALSTPGQARAHSLPIAWMGSFVQSVLAQL